MAASRKMTEQLVLPLMEAVNQIPILVLIPLCVASLGFLLLTAYIALYAILNILAPKPRASLPSEKNYITTSPDGSVSNPRPLPCWYDRWYAQRQLNEAQTAANNDAFNVPDTGQIEPAEVEVSVVIPAYNEENRIIPALEEAIEYLDDRFGRPTRPDTDAPSGQEQRSRRGRPSATRRRPVATEPATQAATDNQAPVSGYEILIVDDGSSDRTVAVALAFSRAHRLHDVLRVVRLARNRGKGGAVAHGFRHARGAYVVFADADGASRFADLGNLIAGCAGVADAGRRGIAIGSRGHLVGSAAVVRRSALRNVLMKAFHFVLQRLTPPATSRIRDTQCGFKLFSRAALPHIIPYMHAEGWIFDIEMLMLAESAPPTPVVNDDGAVIGSSSGIRVAEVPIHWHEVDGSKMNLVKDSISMACGLMILRFSWMLGVYRRRTT